MYISIVIINMYLREIDSIVMNIQTLHRGVNEIETDNLMVNAHLSTDAVAFHIYGVTIASVPNAASWYVVLNMVISML